MVGLGALLVAFTSATQDIVIDAYRVESLSVDEQAAGMAGYVAAYRVGMLVSGAGVVGLTAWLETRGFAKTAVWPIAYGGCRAAGAGRAAGRAAGARAARRVSRTQPRRRKIGRAGARAATARDAFADFLSRDAALAVLVFVVLYKLCDALAGAMTAPFVLVALGYDKATYAAIVKGVGLAALLVGGFAGGAVARALPLVTALWLGAILQMVSNLAFVWLWLQPPSAWALTVAIVIENFTGAIGTVIFVAYISALCGNPLHTATQYALLTALASTGRTLLVLRHRLRGRRPSAGRRSSSRRRRPRCRRWRCWPGCSVAGILRRWMRSGRRASPLPVLHGERVQGEGQPHAPALELAAAPHSPTLPAPRSGERETSRSAYCSRNPCAMILRITLGSAARSRSRRATQWQRCGSAQKVSVASAGTMAR